MLGIGIGVGSTVSIGGTAPPAPPEGLLAAASALEALHDVPDDEGGWTGFTTETFDTTVVCATPDEVQAAITSWRSDPSKLLDCLCDWDGILDLTSSYFSGLSVANLTADAGIWGGYARPTGGVRVRNQPGRTPAIGNPAWVFSFPKLEFNGIGFCPKRLGGDPSTRVGIYLQRVNPTWPLPTALVVKNCKLGLTHWRPAEPSSEYCTAIAINSSLVLSVHVEDCDFAGNYDRCRGPAKFWRVWNNYVRNTLNDFVGIYGFVSSRDWTTEDRASIWVEGNIVCSSVNDPAYSALHQDFVQIGAPTDEHDGYSVLCRYNVVHTSGDNVGSSQGFFANDAPSQSNEYCVYENIIACTAYHGIQFWDRVGERSSFAHNNTVVAAGLRPSDVYQWITLNPYDLPGGDGFYGDISIKGNICVRVLNAGGYPTNESGNLFASPVKNVVSGDGTEYTRAMRYEDVFTGTFARDGADFLTYTLTGEGDANKAVSFYAIVDQFRPVAGWGSAGCSDPATWPNAPVRP